LAFIDLRILQKQNLLYQDLSEGSQSSSTGNKVSALEPSQNEQPSRTVAVHGTISLPLFVGVWNP